MSFSLSLSLSSSLSIPLSQDLIAYIKSQHSAPPGTAGAGFYHSPPRVSGVIYVHNRKDTASLATLITKFAGIKAVAYHAGLKDTVRAKSQASWTNGSAPICVATIAFG